MDKILMSVVDKLKSNVILICALRLKCICCYIEVEMTVETLYLNFWQNFVTLLWSLVLLLLLLLSCGWWICRQCEWFKIDLPEYLFPATSDVDASIIDTDVIREVCEVRQTWCLLQVKLC